MRCPGVITGVFLLEKTPYTVSKDIYVCARAFALNLLPV